MMWRKLWRQSCRVRCLVLPSTSILFQLVFKQVGHLTAWSELLMPRRSGFRPPRSWRSVASSSGLVITVVVAKIFIFSLNSCSYQSWHQSQGKKQKRRSEDGDLTMSLHGPTARKPHSDPWCVVRRLTCCKQRSLPASQTCRRYHTFGS